MTGCLTEIIGINCTSIKLSTINPSIHLEGVNLTLLLGHTLLTILTYIINNYIITTSVLTIITSTSRIVHSSCHVYYDKLTFNTDIKQESLTLHVEDHCNNSII